MCSSDLASAALTAVLYWDLGAPTSARMGRRGQREAYGPSLRFGLGQFVGQTLLLCVGVYVARRWGRVRL